MKIVAAYIRVSTDDQIEYSPESQIKTIREYAKRNDMIVPNEFIFMDEGISGKKAEKRPEFMRMIGMAKAKPKPFDAILLWKFSRFARNREDSIVYKSMLRKQLGIDVISISENIGDDKMSILIEALIEAMDEYYSINLAEEVKRGMTEKAHRGEPLAIAPFGYKIENKQLIEIPEEISIIRQVFAWYNDGVGMLRIAKNLNQMGVRTHRGSKIENRTVEYWLNNPAYNGKIRWTPSGKTSRNYNNPDSLIVSGAHNKVIDDELWANTQKLLKDVKSQYSKWIKPRSSLSHWLTSITRCSVCGGAMVNCAGYLYCNNSHKGTCTGVGSIKTSACGDIVINSLKDIVTDTNMNKNIIIERRTATTSLSPYPALLKKAQIKLQRVKEAYENGIDTIEEYKENKQKIQKEITDIEQKIKQTQPTPEVDAMPALKEKIIQAIKVLENNTIDNVEKNRVLRTFVKEIIKSKDDITLKFSI